MAKKDPADTVNITLRIKESLRAKLADSARQQGNSLNAEMARRLEQSIRDEEMEVARFGNANIYKFCLDIAHRAKYAEQQTGKRFWEDAETTELAMRPIQEIVDMMRAPDAPSSRNMVDAQRQLIRALMQKLTEADPSFAATIRVVQEESGNE